MSPAVESIRLFIASSLSEETKRFLNKIIDELKKSGSDTKWVAEENIHLTFRFLGHTPVEKIETISKVLSETYSKKPALLISLDRLGCFPSLSAPQIIWTGINDSDGFLKKTSEALEKSLEKIGFEKESRKFQAHITLGRTRSSVNKRNLIEKINTANSFFEKRTFCIDNITLFESLLTPQGPVHSVLHQVKLV